MQNTSSAKNKTKQKKPLVSVLVTQEFMDWLSGSFTNFTCTITWTILEEGQWAKIILASLHDDIREVLLIIFLTGFFICDYIFIS